MRRAVPTLVLCALLTACLATAAEARACRDASARPGAVSAARHATAIRCLVNAHRQAREVRRLAAQRHLGAAARRHTLSMVRRRFLGHVGPGGTTPRQRVARAGYPRAGSWSVGETLAWGEGRGGTPRALVRRWLRSPSHRRIALSPRWSDIGVAVVVRGRRATVTADFGRP